MLTNFSSSLYSNIKILLNSISFSALETAPLRDFSKKEKMNPDQSYNIVNLYKSCRRKNIVKIWCLTLGLERKLQEVARKEMEDELEIELVQCIVDYVFFL